MEKLVDMPTVYVPKDKVPEYLAALRTAGIDCQVQPGGITFSGHDEKMCYKLLGAIEPTFDPNTHQVKIANGLGKKDSGLVGKIFGILKG